RPCRYCCKSLFALLIKNSKGYRRDVRVNMWRTSSPDDKLVTDLAKATEAIKIAARRSDRLMAGKILTPHFWLFLQKKHRCDVPTRPRHFRGIRGRRTPLHTKSPPPPHSQTPTT